MRLPAGMALTNMRTDGSGGMTATLHISTHLAWQMRTCVWAFGRDGWSWDSWGEPR